MIAITEDITNRKRAEGSLAAAQVQLTHKERVITMGELAAPIGHEVNQPVSAVVTNGNAFIRWLSATEPNLEEVREAAASIIKEGTRAAR